VGGGGVARLAGVDDDDRAALAPELERGGESGGRSADDGYVAVALDRAVCVFTHGFNDTVRPNDCKRVCDIRKNGMEGRSTCTLPSDGNTIAVKIRLQTTDPTPEQRAHPGRDWFFGIDGRVRLLLGERAILVKTGEAILLTGLG